jgi:hypothetical protein
MTTLEETLTRLQEATGPDRGLDHDITLLMFPGRFRTSSGYTNRGAGWCVELENGTDIGMHECARYTASIDAALTLVPEGLAWMTRGSSADDAAHPFGTAYVATPGLDLISYPAPTAALALCIAALKARQAAQAASTPTP